MESEELKIADTTNNTTTETREEDQPIAHADAPISIDTDTHSEEQPTTAVVEVHDELSSATIVEASIEPETSVRQTVVARDTLAGNTLVETRTEVHIGVRHESSRPLGNGTHVVTADSIEAEQVPTIPLDSLQTINALQPEISVRPVRATSAVSMPEPLVVQPSEYRRGLGEWIQIWRDGLRLKFLPLSLGPVLLGSALAWTQTIARKTPFGHFQWPYFVGMLIVVLLIQIGAHLVNDYYDYLRGVDTSNTLGPGGLIQQGHIRPTRVLGVGLTLLIVGGLLGLVVALRGGPLVVGFGLLVVVCAYFYSATSFSLSSKGLGELVGFFLFGPLLTVGAYMIQTGGQQSSRVFIYSLALGFLAAAVLFANNMRDIEGDEHAGKRTLANLMGMTLSRIAYIVLLLAAYAIVVPQGIMPGTPHLILLTLWTFPTLVVAISGVLRTKAPAGFHLVMRQTLKLEIFFVVLLVIALIITTVIPVLPQIQINLLKL
jgi:1,4-dihydroxy-2-naphthoate octaprenyltransferase